MDQLHDLPGPVLRTLFDAKPRRTGVPSIGRFGSVGTGIASTVPNGRSTVTRS